MALVLNDRVKETTTTTGTGTLNLAGAATNFETFVAGIGDGNTVYYAIVHQDQPEFEVGLGTVTDATPDTLSRTTILSSSNSDGLVSFSAGTKDVFCTLPASKAVFKDGSGSVGALVANDGITVDNITIDGTEIDLSSGDLTLDVAGNIVFNADGGGIQFYDGSDYIGSFGNSSTNFSIMSRTNDKDIVFKGIDNSSTITALTLDMSNGGRANFNNDIGLNDDRGVRFGSDDDSVIYNDNSNLYIKNSTTNQDIIFQGNDDGSTITALTLDMSNAGNASFNGRVTANAGVVVDNITIDGQEIDVSSGDLTLDVAGNIYLNADGNQILFLDASTSYGRITSNSSDLTLQSDISDQDITFKGNDGGNFIEAGRFDMSEGGRFYVGKTSGGTSTVGVEMRGDGLLLSTRDGDVSTILRRNSSDGEILRFQKDATTVGSIANIGSAPVFRNVNEDGISVLTDGGRAILVSTNNSGLQDDDGQIGTATYRWNKAYIKDGVTTGSDQNEKQNIENLTSKELNVANKLSALFKTYKWKDSVVEKGDKARTHTGIIAQDIQSAFSAEGLDASDYGMFMSDTWWEKEITVNAVEADEEKGIEAKDAYTYMDTKEEKTDGYTEKTRLGVRYPELFSFIFSSIEARLTALEAK
jgi:hypothetical protein